MFSSQSDFKQNDLWEFLNTNLSEDHYDDLRAKFKADCKQFLITQIHLEFENPNWIRQVFKSKCLSEFTDAQPNTELKKNLTDEQKIENLFKIIESGKEQVHKQPGEGKSNVDISQLQKSKFN